MYLNPYLNKTCFQKHLTYRFYFIYNQFCMCEGTIEVTVQDLSVPMASQLGPEGN